VCQDLQLTLLLATIVLLLLLTSSKASAQPTIHGLTARLACILYLLNCTLEPGGLDKDMLLYNFV